MKKRIFKKDGKDIKTLLFEKTVKIQHSYNILIGAK